MAKCLSRGRRSQRPSTPRGRPSDWVKEFAEISTVKFSTNNADFDPPIYNVWKQQTKTPGPDHFGNSEPRWLDNLLYLYTEPGSIVIDPFAGSGSTIDVCKKRQHDLTEGLLRKRSQRPSTPATDGRRLREKF